MRCGLTPEQFWDYSWYELDLVSERYRHHTEQQWNHTRHIMAALSGSSPQKILRLPTIDGEQKIEVITEEDAARILEKYKNRLTPTP